MLSAKRHLEQAQDAQARYYNARRDTQISFKVGDKVLLDASNLSRAATGAGPTRKLTARYYGPFVISAIVPPLNYRLDLPNNLRIHPEFHVEMLKAYHEADFHRSVSKPTLPPFVVDQAPYFVDEILVSEKRDGVLMHRVRWAGCNNDDAVWVSDESLKSVTNVRPRRARRDNANLTRGV